MAKGLARSQRRALAALIAVDALRTFYLAGGSAIAVHLAHRRSDDLDLFSRSADVDIPSVEMALARVPGIRVISVSDVTVKAR